MRSWDSRGHRFRVTYDDLHRPVDSLVSTNGAPEQLLSRVVYGDALAVPELTNHRGRAYRVYDGAGVATSEAFDFKGQPLSESRQLALDPKATPDWSALAPHSTIAAMASAAAPLLNTETFSASSQRDALGRTIEAVSPDGSRTRYAYDEGGGLRQVTLEPRGAAPAQTVVGNITYDAKGQRLQVIHGALSAPVTTTDYSYDPQTHRLTRLKTTRGSDAALLQSLHYHYDPAGNITDIRDTAQQTVFFQNTVVEAANSYTYDALGRLTEATGREHASQGTTQRTATQLPTGPQPMASDPSVMRRYTQRYTYDGAGNILKLQHLPSSGTGWTRHYQYAADGNRLLATSAPGDPANGPYSHSYTYDAHGSMVTMPHLAALSPNALDQLQHATAGTQEVHFQYASGSNRSRKHTEHDGGTTEERIYLGPFELYRKRVNGQLDLERETLHVSDGTGRICMVETKTVDAGTPVLNPTPMWRFQLGNHLGSVATEVSETSAVISHEEYHPYGTSAYRAVDSSIEVSARRYRYTGMERDEETGLAYHTARYYAPWLGRWTAVDPIGLSGEEGRYAYASGNPVLSADLNGRMPPDFQLPDVLSSNPATALQALSEHWHYNPTYKRAYQQAKVEYSEEKVKLEAATTAIRPKQKTIDQARRRAVKRGGAEATVIGAAIRVATGPATLSRSHHLSTLDDQLIDERLTVSIPNFAMISDPPPLSEYRDVPHQGFERTEDHAVVHSQTKADILEENGVIVGFDLGTIITDLEKDPDSIRNPSEPISRHFDRGLGNVEKKEPAASVHSHEQGHLVSLAEVNTFVEAIAAELYAGQTSPTNADWEEMGALLIDINDEITKRVMDEFFHPAVGGGTAADRQARAEELLESSEIQRAVRTIGLEVVSHRSQELARYVK